MPEVRIDYVKFEGGLDLVTPPLAIKPGFVREAQNYEIGEYGGYHRLDGYERYDGRPKPHDATYTVLACTITGSISAGDTITGVTSAATGYVIAVEAAAVVFTKGTGTFVSGEVLNVAAAPQATTTADPVQDGASSQLLAVQYANLAADAYRSDIAAVPGSGRIRGIKSLGDVMYAWRDNAGGTAMDIYKSTAGGWSLVALGRELAFTSGGTYEVQEGDTITGAISGATAVITRVALESGSWAAGSAAGKLIFASQTGTFQAETLNVGANIDVATIAGNSSAITLQPGGRIRAVRYNFGGGLRLYGCDGVNRGFEFDGTVYVPISTGMSSDSPDHVACHKNHLFFAFDNSLQFAGIGQPYAWTPLLGAGELNLGETTTNLLPQPGDAASGGAMACSTRNRLYLLYGNDSSDWQLVTLAHDAGAMSDTMQNIGGTYMLDDRGVTNLLAAQEFGNFSSATVSDRVRPWLVENKAAILDSCIVREKNQYRLIFSGGRMMYMTLVGNKLSGFMPQLMAHSMVLAESVEMSDGTEVIFYADDDGYVYQSEVGTSFDGEAVESYLTFVFNHMGGPRTLKQFRNLVLEVGGEGYATFYVGADIGYADTEIPQIAMESITAALSSGHWDLGVWDVGFWDGRILAPAEKELLGVAENVGIRLAQSSDYEVPLTFYGALTHYTPRRLMRHKG